jgi:hypothetical protein
MSTHPLSLNYRYELPGRSLLENIKRIAKDSFQMVGAFNEALVVTASENCGYACSGGKD